MVGASFDVGKTGFVSRVSEEINKILQREGSMGLIDPWIEGSLELGACMCTVYSDRAHPWGPNERKKIGCWAIKFSVPHQKRSHIKQRGNASSGRTDGQAK